MVRALAAALECLVGQIATLTARLQHAASELPDGRLLMSFPRAGQVRAAQILAELGCVRERYPSADALAAEAGVAPVTRQSGKSRGVVFRLACNRRPRAAVTCFADNSRQASAWAAAVYARAKSRGCDHPHAVRVLARAWVRVLWRVWQDWTSYDPAAHKAAQAGTRLQPA
jgi:transposase